MMHVGKHVVDRSPNTLAYDHAKSEWGLWIESNRVPQCDEVRMSIEGLLITAYGQAPHQARITTEHAFMSVTDQEILERNGGIQ